MSHNIHINSALGVLAEHLKEDRDFRDRWEANITMAMLHAESLNPDLSRLCAIDKGSERFTDTLIDTFKQSEATP